MSWQKCPKCDTSINCKKGRIETCGGCGKIIFPDANTRAEYPARINLRDIHDAVLPEVVGDYEAAEA